LARIGAAAWRTSLRKQKQDTLANLIAIFEDPEAPTPVNLRAVGLDGVLV
jgi:hypothetical protein